MKRLFNKMKEIEREMNEHDLKIDNQSEKLSIMSDKLNGIPFNKYHYSKIYRLSSSETDDVYYGSTTKTGSGRMSGHKSDYKMYKKGKFHYVTSFEIMKYADAKLEIVAKIKCNNKKELEQIERLYIENNTCINKVVPGRSFKEYYQENKNKIKGYYQENKAKILEKNKRKFNCPCGGKYSHGDIRKHERSAKHQNYISSISTNSDSETDECITDSE